MSELDTVQDGMVVGLDYTLRLQDGDIVDTSDGQGPLTFLPGTGQLIPGLEQELYGMALEEEKDVVVQPVEGYGEYDPQEVHVVPHSAFPPALQLEPGMQMRVRDRLGQVRMATVANIDPEGVSLDLNHPLAGKTLYFHVRIANLRPATEADMAHSCGSSCGSCCGGCG